TLNLSSVSAVDATSYTVVVSGDCTGPVTSSAASLTLNAAPSISSQPANQTVCAGNNATFSVSVSGTPAPSIQWQVSTNGGASFSDISGATASSVTITNAQLSQSGNFYHAVATNLCGSITSSNATLTVNPLPSATITAASAVCASSTG